MSSPADLLLLFGAGILAGIVSVVASLASLVSYPALLALGLPPVSANVTNTVALMFTGLGATIAHSANWSSVKWPERILLMLFLLNLRGSP